MVTTAIDTITATTTNTITNIDKKKKKKKKNNDNILIPMDIKTIDAIRQFCFVRESEFVYRKIFVVFDVTKYAADRKGVIRFAYSLFNYQKNQPTHPNHNLHYTTMLDDYFWNLAYDRLRTNPICVHLSNVQMFVDNLPNLSRNKRNQWIERLNQWIVKYAVHKTSDYTHGFLKRIIVEQQRNNNFFKFTT